MFYTVDTRHWSIPNPAPGAEPDDTAMTDERQIPALAPQKRNSRNRLLRIYLNPLMWTLQGWLAMFYLAAGYAKLTEPRALMVFMLEWPSEVGQGVVIASGCLEIALALGLLTPIFSWTIWRPVLLLSTGVILVKAIVLATLYLLHLNLVLAVENLAIMPGAMAILIGRWKSGSPQRDATIAAIADGPDRSSRR